MAVLSKVWKVLNKKRSFPFPEWIIIVDQSYLGEEGGGGESTSFYLIRAANQRQNWDEVKWRKLIYFFSPFLEEKFKSLGRLGTEIKISEIYLILPHSGSQKGTIGMR